MRSTDRGDAAKGTDRSDPTRGDGDGIAEEACRGRRTTAARGAQAGDGAPGLLETVLRHESDMHDLGLVSIVAEHRRLAYSL